MLIRYLDIFSYDYCLMFMKFGNHLSCISKDLEAYHYIYVMPHALCICDWCVIMTRDEVIVTHFVEVHMMYQSWSSVCKCLIVYIYAHVSLLGDAGLQGLGIVSTWLHRSKQSLKILDCYCCLEMVHSSHMRKPYSFDYFS